MTTTHQADRNDQLSINDQLIENDQVTRDAPTEKILVRNGPSVAFPSVFEATERPEFAHTMRGYDRLQVDDYVERLNEWVAQERARTDAAECMAVQLQEQLRTTEGRLRRAERSRPSPEHVVLAATARAEAAVQTALREADVLRSEARDEAGRLLAGAQESASGLVERARLAVVALAEAAQDDRTMAAEQAESTIQSAKKEAETILKEARTESRRKVEEATAKADRLRQATEELIAERRRDADASLAEMTARREEVMSDLGRLRGALQALLDAPSDSNLPQNSNGDATVTANGATPTAGPPDPKTSRASRPSPKK